MLQQRHEHMVIMRGRKTEKKIRAFNDRSQKLFFALFESEDEEQEK
jgi:hypothetical protein